MLNGVVGTKLKVVRGYKGSGEAALAVERGEADGTLMPWEFLKSAHADWIKERKITLVARYVRRAIAERPEVPSVRISPPHFTLPVRNSRHIGKPLLCPCPP